MTGILIAVIAWGIVCMALLILLLGSVDDIRDALTREKALRAAAEALLTHEQLAIRDISVQLAIPPQDVAARLERALWTDMKGPLL